MSCESKKYLKLSLKLLSCLLPVVQVCSSHRFVTLCSDTCFDLNVRTVTATLMSPGSPSHFPYNHTHIDSGPAMLVFYVLAMTS